MKAEELLREAADFLNESPEEFWDGRAERVRMVNDIRAFLADPPRCKNCRWWERYDIDFGRCENSGKGPDKYTEQLFSCIHHEPITPKDEPEEKP